MSIDCIISKQASVSLVVAASVVKRTTVVRRQQAWGQNVRTAVIHGAAKERLGEPPTPVCLGIRAEVSVFRLIWVCRNEPSFTILAAPLVRPPVEYHNSSYAHEILFRTWRNLLEPLFRGTQDVPFHF